MSDDAGTQPKTDAPAAPDPAATPPAGTDGAPAAPADDTSAGSLTPEDARKLRSEAKNLRDRLKAAEDRVKELEDADLSERQKAERDLATERARASQLESRLRDASVAVAAGKLGVKPDLVDAVSTLISWDDVDADDPKAVEKAVKELLKERPSLSGKPEGLDPAGGRGNGRAAGGASLTELLLEKTGRT